MRTTSARLDRLVELRSQTLLLPPLAQVRPDVAAFSHHAAAAAAVRRLRLHTGAAAPNCASWTTVLLLMATLLWCATNSILLWYVEHV